MISDELRRQADMFVELNDLRHNIERAGGGMKASAEKRERAEADFNNIEIL